MLAASHLLVPRVTDVESVSQISRGVRDEAGHRRQATIGGELGMSLEHVLPDRGREASRGGVACE